MCNEFIEILSGILNIYGTVITVTTVINIDFKSLSIGGSIKKISHPELDVFANRENALNGIAIMIVGFLLGIIEKHYEFNLLSVIIACVVILVIIMFFRIYYYMQYIFLIQEFDKYLIRNGKDSLIDGLRNGEEIRNVKVPIKFNVNKYIKTLE